MGDLLVLLSDPDAEVSSWPLELVALRDKIHGDASKSAEKECSSLRDELSVGEDKWKQRRNISFDQNRQLEEVTRERDDLKRVAVSLHRVVGQLVAYCASAEDELNRTVLAQLLARLVPGDNDTLIEEESRPTTPNVSGELNHSVVSRSGRHVHFAPDLNAILTDLDEESIVNFLQQQRDLSADIKKELENSLRRLRHEAHSLLDLSAKLAPRIRPDTSNMLESSIQITELVHDLDNKENCDNCELHRKNMEEAMAECLQRENLLRSDLEAAMIKIAQLMTSGEVIAEGYGTGPQLCSLPPRSRPAPTSAQSLDGSASPRVQRLAHDIDSLQKERDDLHQQLEAANRQLRSTRQFVEEQAAEREAERDEFARRLQDLRDENTRLATRLQNNARILNETKPAEKPRGGKRSQSKPKQVLKRQGPQKDTCDKDGFKVVEKRKKKKPPCRNQCGTALTGPNMLLRPAVHTTLLYVSRLHHSTKAEEIVEYLRIKTKWTLRVERLEPRHNMNFNSFVVRVPTSDLEKFLKEDLWPKGVVFRRFRGRLRDTSQRNTTPMIRVQ